jgi:hypothetical protein
MPSASTSPRRWYIVRIRVTGNEAGGLGGSEVAEAMFGVGIAVHLTAQVVGAAHSRARERP